MFRNFKSSPSTIHLELELYKMNLDVVTALVIDCQSRCVGVGGPVRFVAATTVV